ncbi:MAG: glycosyl hydrolase family 65 protein, partial [Pseudomonadota bacterium]
DTSNRQRHISSAVAYNVWHYYEVTGDQQFLCDHGAEMLIEIARFWASLAQFNPGRERYEIRGVMGPDEFHTAWPGRDPSTEGGLDNNAYTNVLAAWVFNRARDALEVIPPDHARRLRESLRLTDRELELWFDISRKLFVPFHDGGIISQFEGYEELEEFDWEGAREKYGDIQRLDRILEAEGDDPNRYKASKQADVLMLFYIFSADELAMLFEQLGYPFDAEMIPRNVEYYLARTSHGSTLSWIVHSWVLARGDRRNSWRLFKDALDSDIADIQGGTTPEGVHLGAMAGTVDLIQRAYLGIETRGSVLHFNPDLPDALDCLSARMVYRGQELDLTATQDRLRVESRPLTADPIMIAYRGRFRSLSPGNVREFRLIRPEERDRAETDACRPVEAEPPAGERIREPSS